MAGPKLRGSITEAPQSLEQMAEEFYAAHPWSRGTVGEIEPMPPQHEREQLNALYSAQAPADNFFNALLPVNVRAAYGTYIGGDNPLSQYDFMPEDLRALREHYLRGQAAYAQHPYDPNMSYAQYSQQIHDMRPVQSLPGPMNVLQSYTDQNYRLSPFTSGASYEQSPEGTYLTNTYQINGYSRPVRILLPQ